MHDNVIFNVNGEGEDLLRSTLYFAFRASNHSTAEGWKITPEKGLILYWMVDPKQDTDVTKFPVPMGSDNLMGIVKAFLESEDTWKTAEFVEWDKDLQHDGSNGRGWRVYTEDWGHVGSSRAFLAITPAYMWYGK
jgi:hypothetical protein